MLNYQMASFFENCNPCRSTALEQLALITPKLGRLYTDDRNFDRGIGNHTGVTMLSPWIRHRLLLEEEVVSSALRAHSFLDAEKFIQEIFWRTYWKGWLELHPKVWIDFKTTRDRDLYIWEKDERLSRALAGVTGIKCFDHWLMELRQTHYLHNHARMWFASIWVFTLGLPWTIGADLFMQLLLDGDPASNTLSWRWISGLQTKGKTYLARADNIEKYTEGRFKPDNQLALEAKPIEETELPNLKTLEIPMQPEAGKPSILLLHDDDLSPENTSLPHQDIVGIALMNGSERRSPNGVAQNVYDFVEAGLKDATQRLSNSYVLPLCEAKVEPILQLAHKTGAQRIICSHAPTGPIRDAIDDFEIQLGMTEKPNRLVLETGMRAWDSFCWPHARKGFFNFKKNIPVILSNLIVL